MYPVIQKELREEDHRYRDYLVQLKQQEKLHQEQLERLCDAEVEKMWEKRVAQWRLERQARKQLLQEVMEYRRIQLQDKRQYNVFCVWIIFSSTGSVRRPLPWAHFITKSQNDFKFGSHRHLRSIHREVIYIGQYDILSLIYGPKFTFPL